MKRNKINSESGACQNKPPKQAGSTMIAVLAAMVFIGVVTASMVKNTGSQSAASRSYGSLQTMSSTARSGMIATETYFKNNWSGVKEKWDAYLEAEENKTLEKNRPFIFGTAKNNKQQLAANQYFNSQIHNFDSQNDHPRYVSFDVNAGRGSSGKDLKKARAYYRIANSNDITIQGTAEFGGKNSFSAEENATVKAGNSGAVFHGHATFEKGLYIQNEKPVKFVKDENGEGSVVVLGRTEILNNAAVEFEVDAYFDGTIKIQNIPNSKEMFKANVGFNGDSIDIPANKQIGFGGNVWFNGKYITPILGGTDNATLTATGTNSKFYYSNKISMKTQAMCKGLDPCQWHGNSHSLNQSEIIQSALKKNSTEKNSDGFVNMHKDSTSGYLGSNISNIRDRMEEANKNTPQAGKGMTAADRREPSLNIDKALCRNEDGCKEDEQKEFKNIFDKTGWNYDILDAGGNLNGAGLQAYYDKTCCDGPNYENGHLLVEIPKGTNVMTNGGAFDGKVIFRVEGQLNGDASFYTSKSDEASTLVHVGKEGVLSQFGVGANGTFRGLVYIDSSNNEQQSFAWGHGSQIQGAVILKGGNLYWNASNSVMDIYRNNDVLKNYSFLKAGPQEENNRTVTTTDPTNGVTLRAFGYYFF